MSDALLHNESPTEYFRTLVETALHRQHVDVQELTSFYVVNLLAGFVRLDRRRSGFADEPLGVRLAEALHAPAPDRRQNLRRIGDTSLFISGFFSDSLKAGLVDVDYYVQLGERAYGSLAGCQDETLSRVFVELAAKFAALVDVLNEVSEQSALTSNTDVVRLYEKWLKTGSRRSGTLLAARGIVPIARQGTKLH